MSHSKKTFIKDEERMRVVVWFDRPHGEICVADRLDTVKKGEIIPEDRIIRVPLEDGEDFIEAVFNASMDHQDFENILEGIQKLLDKRAVDAVGFSEKFRGERKKRGSGGLINRNNNMVHACADELIKLRELKEKATAFLVAQDREGSVPANELLEWMEDKELYEPG